jgi:hypothetical protein
MSLWAWIKGALSEATVSKAADASVQAALSERTLPTRCCVYPLVAGCLQVPPSSLVIGTPVGSAGFHSSHSAATARCASASGRATTAPPCPGLPPVGWSVAPPPVAAHRASCLPFTCRSFAPPEQRRRHACPSRGTVPRHRSLPPSMRASEAPHRPVTFSLCR